ncbi:diacylglycerol/lipid kinase family protein [Ekhidna sp.]|uniref:diacylglycerol/lipid kinase family protein n=1 Tax=Ekhidna sp. TaxID=2608089 RepID=UPI003C797D70
MDKQKVLFVINPISGGTSKDGLYKLIEDFCDENNYAFNLLKTTGKHDSQSIKQEIDTLKPSLVVAGGGDGTIKLVAEELLGTTIKLGILPLGSANGLATELEIPENWNANLDLLKESKSKKIDAIRVNDELCLHLSDVGFNADLIKEFEEDGTRGKLGYAMSFVKQLSKRKKSIFQIEIDGEPYSYKAEMIVLANASKYGTGAVVNPRCDMQDGLLEVCVFMPLPWYRFFHLTWHSFIGRLEESEYFAIHQGKNVTISSKNSRTLQVDGEVIGKAKKVKAEVLKGALDVVVPA